MKKTAIGFITSLCLLGSLCAEDPAQAASEHAWIKDYISSVPNFPKEGIIFKCYPKLLEAPEAFHRTIRTFARRYQEYNLDAIVGLDSRGFVFGAALAYEMRLPFVMVRKAGKLPRQVERIEYSLEYGKNAFELEVDSIKPGDRVLIIDDVLATGGTAQAASELVERLGGEVVEVACLIEIGALEGRKNVKAPVFTLVSE
jgi:adenine phosphoribosyltransferase